MYGFSIYQFTTYYYYYYLMISIILLLLLLLSDYYYHHHHYYCYYYYHILLLLSFKATYARELKIWTSKNWCEKFIWFICVLFIRFFEKGRVKVLPISLYQISIYVSVCMYICKKLAETLTMTSIRT